MYRNLDQPNLNITSGHTTTESHRDNTLNTHIKENGYQYGGVVDIKGNSFTHKISNGEQQQFSSAAFNNNIKNSKNSGVSENCVCKNLYNNKINKKMDNSNRDRLGQWGTISDSETPGNLSGLERIRNGRYNKVRESEILKYRTSSAYTCVYVCETRAKGKLFIIYNDII